MLSLYFELCSAHMLEFGSGLGVVLKTWHSGELHRSQSSKEPLAWPYTVIIFRLRIKNNTFFVDCHVVSTKNCI